MEVPTLEELSLSAEAGAVVRREQVTTQCWRDSLGQRRLAVCCLAFGAWLGGFLVCYKAFPPALRFAENALTLPRSDCAGAVEQQRTLACVKGERSSALRSEERRVGKEC